MYVYNTRTLLFTMKHVDAILDASDNVISEMLTSQSQKLE